VIGLELAKMVFQVLGCDAQGRVVIRRRLRRPQVLAFFANLEPCLVGMETCVGAHYRAREIGKLGHEVRGMAPQFVKPYLKASKNDRNDAEAICEAVQRPSMRFVPLKHVGWTSEAQSTKRRRSRLTFERLPTLLQPGGCYCFTVLTYRSRPLFQDPENIALLRATMRDVMAKRRFETHAIVIRSDRIHVLWRLPDDDADFSRRWRDIKHQVSRRIDAPLNHRREKLVWQRRFWEHVIRDQDDWRQHMDCVHFNPVKHGLVGCAADWPYDSFLRCVERGWYDRAWGCDEPGGVRGWSLE
jgi:putative transposase